MKPTISVIYIYYNTPQEIIDSILSFKKTIKKITYEIIVVDNNSPKPFPKKNLIKNINLIKNKQNIGFGRAVNQAVKKAKSKYLLILNPDTIVLPGSIDKLYKKYKSDKKTGILAPQLLNQQKKILPSISRDPQGLLAVFSFSIINNFFPKNKFSKTFWMFSVNRKKEQNVEVVGGACLMIGKKLFEELGGFDERFFMYFEESDLCYRVRQKEYNVIYFPKSKIIHLIGRSSSNKDWIQQQFEKSRLKYLQKYHGWFVGATLELIIRFLQPSSLALFAILCISTFVNLYKISSLMMFFGDFGRDYLAARDMIIYHRIPLIGIASSVPWLHQGPLSIYFIGLTFIVSNFSPVAPAVFYGLIGILSTYFVYLLGKKLFSKSVGLLSALFFATSPLVIISMRMPYHTAGIPVFSTLFFLFLYKTISEKKIFLIPTVFIFGILMLLEISNISLVIVLLLMLFFYREKFSVKIVTISILSFLIATSPFILYDILHKFIISKKAITAIGSHLSFSNHTTTYVSLWQSISFSYGQMIRFLFPSNHMIAVFIAFIVLATLFLYGKKLLNNKAMVTCLVCLFIPLVFYTIRFSTSFAYYPVLYPVAAIFIGFTANQIIRWQKIALLFFLAICMWNSFYTISNYYFLNSSGENGSNAIGWNYGLGTSLSQQQKVAHAIVYDANRKQFTIKGAGTGFKFSADIDNYIYLIWYDGGKLNDHARIEYLFYQKHGKPLNLKEVIYQDDFIAVTKK